MGGSNNWKEEGKRRRREESVEGVLIAVLSMNNQ